MQTRSTRWLSALLLSGIGAILFVSPTAVRASAASASCAVSAYSQGLAKCSIVPSHGSFKISIPGSKIKLIGSGSGATNGTQITILRIPAPVRSKGGFGIKVNATGSFKPLHLSKGHLWAYNASTNSLKSTKKISRVGIYQIK